jgi:cholest-4-en-3-one 26-monooxygenase
MPPDRSVIGSLVRVEQDPFFTSSPFEPQLDPITSLDKIDLTDPDLLRYGDPHQVWRLLRENAPVFWHAKGTHGTRGKGFWAVTTYAECSEVHRHPEVFSNSDTEFLDLLPEDIPRQLSSMDPPEHAKYRKVLQRFFTGKAVEALTDTVHGIVTQALDAAAEVGEFNFYQQIAAQVPFLATAHLFRLPPEQAQSLAQELMTLDYGGKDPLRAYTEAVMAFFDEFTADWQPGTHDGLMAAVLESHIDDAPMDRAEALAYLWVLFTGALDTTAHAATIGLLSLFHHPEQFDALRSDLSLSASAVTEILRWTSTSNVVKHLVMSDTTLGGVALKAGDYVATYPPSANRDALVFTDPFRFDITRGKQSPVFTFGGGPHLCLGHLFARMELRILFEELLRRFPQISQTGPAERGEAFTMILSPLNELPVKLG